MTIPSTRSSARATTAPFLLNRRSEKIELRPGVHLPGRVASGIPAGSREVAREKVNHGKTEMPSSCACGTIPPNQSVDRSPRGSKTTPAGAATPAKGLLGGGRSGQAAW